MWWPNIQRNEKLHTGLRLIQFLCEQPFSLEIPTKGCFARQNVKWNTYEKRQIEMVYAHIFMAKKNAPFGIGWNENFVSPILFSDFFSLSFNPYKAQQMENATET